MNGVHVGDFRRANHRGNVEVALGQLRRANANRFVGKTDMQRITVGFAVNGHGADAQFLAGADHPQGDLSAIGNENFLEHALDQCGNKMQDSTSTTESQRHGGTGKNKT